MTLIETRKSLCESTSMARREARSRCHCGQLSLMISVELELCTSATTEVMKGLDYRKMLIDRSNRKVDRSNRKVDRLL